MKHYEPQPFMPCVSVRDMINFEISDPETHTASRFVNAFLKIFYETEAGPSEIAEIMQIDERDLRTLLRIEAGTSYQEFHDYWMAYKLNVALAMHPDYSHDEIAREIGFSSRSALWTFYNSKRYKRIAEEMDAVKFPEPQRQSHHW